MFVCVPLAFFRSLAPSTVLRSHCPSTTPNPCEAYLHDDTRVGSDTGPQLSSLLTDGASDGRALHLTLGVDDLQCYLLASAPSIFCPTFQPSPSFRNAPGLLRSLSVAG